MRMVLIAAASAAALLAGPALAQTSNTPGHPPAATGPVGGAGGAAHPAPRQPAPNPLTMQDVSKIQGEGVYGSDGKKLGEVATVLMKPQTKTIDRVVIATGGVLGIGARDVAVPIDQLSWDADNDHFKMAKTANELKAMPEWKAPANAQASSPPPAVSGSSVPPAGTSTGPSSK